MKKNIKNLIYALILCTAVLFVPSKAYADYSQALRIIDDAGILSAEESEEITAILSDVSAEYDLDIAVFFEDVTPDNYEEDYGDDSVKQYCADLFDYGGYTDNGLALLITVEDREWALVTEGYGDVYFNSYVREDISNAILPYLKENDFAGAALQYAKSAKEALDNIGSTSETESSTDTDDSYVYDDSAYGPGYKLAMMNKPFMLLVSLVLGLLVAAIRNGVLKGKLKSVRSNDEAAEYIDKGSVSLRAQRDTFLYRIITERDIKEEDDDDDDDSFTSSSGDIHNGSSGSF